MSLFDEVQFPVAISGSSKGGPQRQTQVVSLGSGAEARNARWRNSRRSYDVKYGIKNMNDMYDVLAFFEARNARLIGFRYKDWNDYKSCRPMTATTAFDQLIGTGDGATATFPLSKAYVSGPSSYTRLILKPVAGTVKIAINGVQTSAFTVSTITGIVTPTVVVPAAQLVTAGFEFDTPVRFDTDSIQVELQDGNAGDIPSIPIMELLNP